MKNIERVNQINEKEINDLNDFTNDWGVWDDFYIFVQDQNQDYIEKNLYFDVLSNQNIDFILYSNSSNDVIFSRIVNYEKNESIERYKDLENFVRQNSLVDIGKKDIKGIITLPEGPAYISMSSVVKSDGTGEIKGKIIAGKFIKSQESGIHSLMNLPINVYGYDTEKLIGYQKTLIESDTNSENSSSALSGFAILENSLPEKYVYIKKDGDKISSYVIFNDIYNTPRFKVYIDTDIKTIYTI